MAEKAESTKNAVEKLNTKLECPICHTTYKNPKLLQCLHIFCKSCLEPLVNQGDDGITLQCPICRRVVQLPPNGVSGLQSDFHIGDLMDIRDAFENIEQSEVTCKHMKCENCEDDIVKGFCYDCDKFMCNSCIKLHCSWKKFKLHKMLTLEQVDENHKDDIRKVLEPVQEQLLTINQALSNFEERIAEVKKQSNVIKNDICKEIDQLHQILEQRKAELIEQMENQTDSKLKSLSIQRDRVELIKYKLSSCLDYVKIHVADGKGKVLATIKASVVKQIEPITTCLKDTDIQPVEEANLELVAESKQDLQIACHCFGNIRAQEISPQASYAQGECLNSGHASQGQLIVAMVTTMDVSNRVYMHNTNLVAELVHCKSKTIMPCDIRIQLVCGQYQVSCRPKYRGKHLLHIRIHSREIKNSPYTIAVIASKEKLAQPMQVIENLPQICSVTIGSNDMIVVQSNNDDERPGIVSVKYLEENAPLPKRIDSVQSDITEDDEGNFYTVNHHTNIVQKFTSDGRLIIKTVGTRCGGKGELEFQCPMGIFFHLKCQKVYVCELLNGRIQVLNPDLTFYRFITFDQLKEHSDSETKYIPVLEPNSISIDSKGRLYVTAIKGDVGHVLVCNEEGKVLHSFSDKGQGEKLSSPYAIAIYRL